MIYTVTFNPSLDYIVGLKKFQLGIVNRSEWEQIFPGGKGINVSIVLNNLGVKNTALGFVGGFTGKEIERGVKAFGCTSDFVHLSFGNSRINVKVKADIESELNGQGPRISKEELEVLFKKLDQIRDGDLLVLAGSIPNSLPLDMYEVIMKRIEKRQIKVIVDATGDLLLKVIKYKPFLIKPNNHELGEMFGKVLKEKEEIIYYAKKLQAMGAQNVLISMAEEGAILMGDDGEVYQRDAPKGEVKNSVGAGDSMVAGFIAGYLKNQNREEAFKMGIAAGSASAFTEGLATWAEIEEIFKKL